MGEFWYKIKLRALPADPEILDPVSCAVGDKVSISVSIDNPLGIDATFGVQVSNKRNFSVEPSQVRVTG